MAKPQVTVRLSPSLLSRLEGYVQRTGTSKTDVVLSALAQYLGCAEEMPLSQRVAEVEGQVAVLETELRRLKSPI